MTRINYSLISLLQDYSICIPAIQREYVQGFDEELNREVREKIFADIFSVLDNETMDDKLKLNIIYGYTEGDTFYPVDGQQRLTTLYILHWFLWIKRNKEIDKSFTDKKLSYEIRQASNQFFEELINPQRQIEFQELLNSKEQFKNAIVSKPWFKSSWIKDVTVLATLNVISELMELRVSNEKAEKYYTKLEIGKIYFNFLPNSKIDAKKKSVRDYTKFNARGKQLEMFENVKSIIYTIEKKLKRELEVTFVYKYDREYIDFFYNLYCSDEKNLEQITMDINDYSTNFLINSYNFLKLLEEKEQFIIDSHLKYYSIIYEESNSSNFNINFWENYFMFMNNVLGNIVDLCYKGEYKKELKLFWEEIIPFKEDYKDSYNIIANLLYYNYYTTEHNNYVSKEIIQKFEYVLKNLAYSKWKQKKLCNINNFCLEVSKCQDILEYFSKDLEADIVEAVLLAKSDIFINDIKVRIKEQIIKVKIIESNGLNYNYFDDLEEVFSEKRSIYFLLYFSGYWEDVVENTSNGDFVKLQQYIKIAKELFKSKATILIRKIFALATYYDQANRKLLDSFKINEEARPVYTIEKKEGQDNVLDSNNLHYWDDSYYFIDDNILKKDIKLRNIKLNKLKIAYDLYDTEQKNEVNKDTLFEQLKDDSYNCCWLKYAIYRNHEEILTYKLKFDSVSKKVNIEVPIIKGYVFNIEKRFTNFFAYVYLLDKKMEGWDTNNYDSYIYDPYTVNVRDTLSKGEYIVYDDLKKNIINQFELKLLWECEEIKYFDNRKFFYHKHTLEVYGSCDEVISIEIENTTIVKRIFHLNDYVEFHYNFSRDKDEIEEKITAENKSLKDISELFQVYNLKKISNNSQISKLNSEHNDSESKTLLIKNYEIETEDERQKFYALINSNYDCIKSYYRNNDLISKYLYNKPIKKKMNIGYKLYHRKEENVLFLKKS